MASAFSRADGEVRVRPAGPADLAALRDLDEAVFQHMAYPFFVLRQLFDLHRPCWLIAEDDRRMRGYALAVPASDGHCGWLIGLGVLAEFQGRGCGRLLITGALEFLAGYGVAEAKLTVDPANKVAIKLYRRSGFRGRRSVPDYLGPGEDRIVMTVRLEPPGADGPGAVQQGWPKVVGRAATVSRALAWRSGRVHDVED